MTKMWVAFYLLPPCQRFFFQARLVRLLEIYQRTNSNVKSIRLLCGEELENQILAFLSKKQKQTLITMIQLTAKFKAKFENFGAPL